MNWKAGARGADLARVERSRRSSRVAAMPRWSESSAHEELLELLRDLERAEELCARLEPGSPDHEMVQRTIADLNQQLPRLLEITPPAPAV